MSELSYKFENAKASYDSLSKLIDKDWLNDDIVRDALIKRFELAYDCFKKLYQAYFRTLGENIVFPKSIFRKMFESEIVEEEVAKLLLEMVDDRNETTHTYKLETAVKVAKKVKIYHRIMGKALDYIANNSEF